MVNRLKGFNNTKARQRWQVLVGILISSLFLWLALRGQDFSQVWEHIRGASYSWLIPAFLFYFVTVAIRTWRWQYLLRPIQNVSFRRLFGVVVIGYLGNNIYPFRIGELLRVYVLYLRENIAVSAGLATLLLERVFDGLTVLMFVFVTLPLTPLPSADMQMLVTFTSIAFLGALLLFFVLAAAPKSALRLVDWVTGRFVPLRWQEKIMEMSSRFLQGFVILRQPGSVVVVLFISVILWFLETYKYWLVIQAFPIEVSFWMLMLMIGVVNLATILPSAPGFIGTFDLPGIAVLVFFGVAEPLATAYILVLHVILWLPSTLFGFVYMLYAGLTWSDFGRATRLAKE